MEARAYPEFIGFGYTGCMTCHFNGAGNGGLNDYGRGLFAAELASKVLWNAKKTDDQLSSTSGFLGSTELPFWFRPSLKFRGLNVMQSPGSRTSQVVKYYQMQQDINLHLPFNEDQTYLVAMNFGTVPRKSAALPNEPFGSSLIVSREYYLRGQITENLWFYLGYLDKVFGVRHADHTAVNRSYLGLGQNDQVHGLIVHWVKDQHEFFVNPFLGNLHVDKEKQFPGLTVHYEYEPRERWRFGMSYMRDRDIQSTEKNTLGFLVKRGLGEGHSLLAELGFRQAVDKTTHKSNASMYAWTQGTMKVRRGVFFQSLMEYLKADATDLSPEYLRFGVGLMMFPFQRVEWRFGARSGRTISPQAVEEDSWGLQSQIHFSF